MYPDYEAELLALVDELWLFVHRRFAFQAKQLKKLCGTTTAQSYEMLACGHGFSGWRGMRQVLDAMHHTDRWHTNNCEGSICPEERHSYAIWMALRDLAANEPMDEFGRPAGDQLEQMLSNLPVIPKDADVEEISEASFEGVERLNEWREVIFHQSVWLGTAPVWGGNIKVIVHDFYWRLLRLVDGDEEYALECTAAIYGVDNLDLFNRPKKTLRALKQWDRQVKNAIAGKPSELPEHTQEGYRCANVRSCLPAANWRSLLRDVHPLSLDARWDDGPSTALLLANAPSDCWITIDLNDDPPLFPSIYPPPGKDQPARNFAASCVYAPTIETASQAAATAGWVPKISRLTRAEAEESKVGHLVGYWSLEWL